LFTFEIGANLSCAIGSIPDCRITAVNLSGIFPAGNSVYSPPQPAALGTLDSAGHLVASESAPPIPGTYTLLISADGPYFTGVLSGNITVVQGGSTLQMSPSLIGASGVVMGAAVAVIALRKGLRARSSGPPPINP
jgi:hypothetical protein